MGKYTNLVLAGFSVALLVVTWNLVVGNTTVRAAGSAPVMVTNTPLPVTAAQSGTWNVNLSNTPAVNISNTPTVALSAGTSLRDADNPARQPFQANSTVQLAPGADTATNFVPISGSKELVIEYVSGFGEIPIGESLTNVSVCTSQRGSTPPNQSPPEVCHFFIPTVTGSYNGTVNNNVISAQTRIYGDACDFPCFVRVQANRNGTNGSGDFHFSISGYFVDVP